MCLDPSTVELMQVEPIGVGGAWDGPSHLAHSKLDHEYRWLKCAGLLTPDQGRQLAALLDSRADRSMTELLCERTSCR